MRRAVILAVVTIGVAGLGFIPASHLLSQAPGASWAPFTALILEKRLNESGQEAYQEYLTVAVRSDGSEAISMRRQDPTGQWVHIRTIVDVMAKKRVAVDPMTESVTTYPLGTASSSPQKECTKDGNPERKTILGYEVVRIREDRLLPGSGGRRVGTDNWVASALNCFPLTESSSLLQPDGKQYTNVREVLSIIPGEPADSLFAIPSTYTERSPSQVFSEYERRFPGHGGLPPSTANKLDSAYYAHQKNR